MFILFVHYHFFINSFFLFYLFVCLCEVTYMNINAERWIFNEAGVYLA